MTLVALLGWTVASALLLVVVRLRHRFALVTQAAHELRGPVAAIAFAVAWLRREPGGVRRALRFETELERMRLGLADLDAARAGRRVPARPRTVPLERLVKGAAAGWRPSATGVGRGLSVSWEAGHALVRVDRARLSQALSNLLANAVEHGSGPIEIRATRKGKRAVRVEVRDGGPAMRVHRRAASVDRGHGLGVAARAVREAGGTLTIAREPGATTAAVELPLVEGEER